MANENADGKAPAVTPVTPAKPDTTVTPVVPPNKPAPAPAATPVAPPPPAPVTGPVTETEFAKLPILNTSTGETDTGPAPGIPKEEAAKKEHVADPAPQPPVINPSPEGVDPYDTTQPGPASGERMHKMIHGQNETGEPLRQDSPPELLISGMPDDPYRQDTPLDRMIHGDPDVK